MGKRIPTDEDYESYDGAHCHCLWNRLSHKWRCPGCGRTKREIMRWTLRTPAGKRFWGWMAGLHQHHDHSQGVIENGSGRFLEVIICDHCNSSDGYIKRKLGLPPDFSFSAMELSKCITSTPHTGHKVNLEKALEIYNDSITKL